MAVDEMDVRTGGLVETLKLPPESGPVSSVLALNNDKQIIWYHHHLINQSDIIVDPLITSGSGIKTYLLQRSP